MAEKSEEDEGVMPAYFVAVETNFEGLEYDEAPLVQAVQSTLRAEDCPEAEIDVILVDDEYLRELKLEFFGIDRYTDAIAFRLNAYEDSRVEGEIYISLHRAVEQAQEYDVTADTEMLRLAIHGTLHLLGYEDEMPEQKQRMTAREDRYLADFVDPLIVQKLP